MIELKTGYKVVWKDGSIGLVMENFADGHDKEDQTHPDEAARTGEHHHHDQRDSKRQGDHLKDVDRHEPLRGDQPAVEYTGRQGDRTGKTHK